MKCDRCHKELGEERFMYSFVTKTSGEELVVICFPCATAFVHRLLTGLDGIKGVTKAFFNFCKKEQD